MSFVLTALLVAPLAARAAPQDAVPSPGFASRWALVVGVSDYDFLPDLKFARDDATAFARALVDEHGFDPSAVTLMTDTGDDPYARPSRAYVLRELRRMLDDPRRAPSDLFVVYFSGHGTGTDGGDYLLTESADVSTAKDVGLEVKTIVELLREEGVKNTLFVMDACREGEHRVPFGRWLVDLPEEERVAVLLACEPGQRSQQSRRLGHGLFTHYLLEAMRSPEVVEPNSGAIWASRVGEWVQRNVAEHTSLDSHPQVPRVVVDATRDVLVGANIGDAPDVAAFAKSAGVSVHDPELYVSVMATYAERLFVAREWEACAATLDAASQRGPLPPPMAYCRAMSLAMTGRAREAARVVRALRKDWPDTYWARVAAVQDPFGSVAPKERLAAAHRCLEVDLPLPDAVIVDLVRVLLELGPPDDSLARVAALAAEHGDDDRLHHYLEAVVAGQRGAFDDALASFSKAAERDGSPDLDLVRLDHANTLVRLRRYPEAREVFARAIDESSEPGVWLVRRAAAAHQVRDFANARADARAALAHPLDPASLIDAVRFLGKDVRDAKDEILAQAAKHPLAWQARIAEIVVTTSGDEMGRALFDVQHLGASNAQFIVGAARVALDITEDLFRSDEIEISDVAAVLDGCFDEIARRAGDLEGDPEGWRLLEELAYDLGRFVELRELCDRHLGPLGAKRSAPLAVLHAMACLNTGDVEAMRTIRATLDDESQFAVDLDWISAAFVASWGTADAAKTALDALPKAPHWLRGADGALRALVAARAGDHDGAREHVRAITDRSPLADALAAHVFVLLEEDAIAGPILGDIASRTGGPFAFAELGALRAYAEQGSADDRRQFALRTSRQLAGNPLVARISFAEPPGIERFTGLQRYELGDLPKEERGLLFLQVTGDGAAEGMITWPGLEGRIVKGEVDAYGNFVARQQGGTDPGRLIGKLVPKGDDAVDALVAEHGIVFRWIGADGLARRWFARP